MTTPAPAAAPAPAPPPVVDYLDEDSIRVPGQNYCLISFVKAKDDDAAADAAAQGEANAVPPSGRERFGLKVRGSFETKQEAEAHVKRLQAADGNLFDIYLCDVGRWLLIPPPKPSDMPEKTEYSEAYLNNLLKEYHANQAEARGHFEQRKKLILEQGLDACLADHEKLPPPTYSEQMSMQAQASGSGSTTPPAPEAATE